MTIDNDIVLNALISVAGFLFLYFILYRKYIFSLADPVAFHVSNLAFSSVLVINVVQDVNYVIHFFGCQLFLFLGFACVQEWLSVKQAKTQTHSSFYDIHLLKYTAYVSFIVFVLANLLIFYSKGFALLSDDPNSAKVTNFQGGFGLVRKINWSIGSFLSASLIILYLVERKGRYLFLIAVFAFFIALDGSKSSLLRIIIVAVLLTHHAFFVTDKRLKNDLKKFIPIGIMAVVAVLYTAFGKNTNSLDQTGFAFLQRLLYGADSVIYFYQPANDYLLTQYGPLDYLHHITNPILGFLRLATYDEALGNIMVENAIPPGVTLDVIAGPNSPYYIEGQIYFGYYGAFVYSFIIGGIFSCCRQLFFSIARAPFFLFALGCALCFHSANILIESTLFITTCFDTCFFVIPIYVLVCLWVNRRLVIRKVRLNLVSKPLIHLPVR